MLDYDDWELPDFYDVDDRLMSRETADKVIVFLLGVMAGGATFATVLCASAAAAIAATAVLLGVWVVSLVVWMLWS